MADGKTKFIHRQVAKVNEHRFVGGDDLKEGEEDESRIDIFKMQGTRRHRGLTHEMWIKKRDEKDSEDPAPENPPAADSKEGNPPTT